MLRSTTNSIYSGYLRMFGTEEQYWQNLLDTDFPCKYIGALPTGNPKAQYETLTTQKNQLIGFLKEFYIYNKWGTADDIQNLRDRSSESSWKPCTDEELKKLFASLDHKATASSKMKVEDYDGYARGFLNQVLGVPESLADEFNQLFFMDRIMRAVDDDINEIPYSARESFSKKTGQEKLDEVLLVTTLGRMLMATLSFLARKKSVELLSYYVSNQVIGLEHRINYETSLGDIIKSNGLEISQLDRLEVAYEAEHKAAESPSAAHRKP